jgi:fumarate reductase flavoprotein subunit
MERRGEGVMAGFAAGEAVNQPLPQQHLRCDVLVVGGGGAGLAAAITAAERGMKVMLVEKQPRLGGSTAMSIGSISAAGTRWQKAKGIADNPEDFLEDMGKFPGVDMASDAPELRTVLAAEAGPALDWLDRIGVAFVGPFPEPPHRVPRMHNIVLDSRMYPAVLERAARRAGVDIRLGIDVEKLVADAQGRVTGAEARFERGRLFITASRGVVLAAGDFSGNADMRRQYLSAAAADSVPANPWSTGIGQRLGLQMGAALRGMAVSTGPKLRFRSRDRRGLLAMLPLWPWLMKLVAAMVQVMPEGVLRPFVKSLLVVHMQPSPKLFEAGAILVNLDGKRVCDETRSVLPIAHEREAAGYVVFDETIARLYRAAPHYISTAPGIGYAYLGDYERARPELVHRGATVEALARSLGADPVALAQSIAAAPKPLTAPFVALGPAVSTVTVTEGGLSVDRRCAVLRADGSPIAGLYAAGGCAQSGMRLSGHGLHIGWAIVSGRLAGAAAAQEIPRRAQ